MTYFLPAPGLKKEEIKVQVIDDGILSISGERSKEEINEKDKYRRVERSYGKFSRQFKLPKNAKPHNVSAKVENGVLTVTVPKSEVTEDAPRLHDVQIS
ncbi:hypothetical protein Mapa_011241 [Marchantia paleacea]|nr:hypothetical protein Mapa_011241 [Marchantia paleacea]